MNDTRTATVTLSRPGVGMIFMADGLLLAGELIRDGGGWKLPQGGIDPGETADEAFWKEAEQELGLFKDHPDIYDAGWIYQPDSKELFRTRYALPAGQFKTDHGVMYSQQDHVWRVMLTSTAILKSIRLDGEDNPEFKQVAFITGEQLLRRTHPMRTDAYEAVLMGLMAHLERHHLTRLRRD